METIKGKLSLGEKIDKDVNPDGPDKGCEEDVFRDRMLVREPCIYNKKTHTQTNQLQIPPTTQANSDLGPQKTISQGHLHGK